MLIDPPPVRSSRAVPDLISTSLPLRRTVRGKPPTTSTRMGPVTATAAPSMVPTESEAGSSERAVNAVRTAMLANAVTLEKSQRARRLEFIGMKPNDTRFALPRSDEHTSELQSPVHLVCRLLLEKKKTTK